MGIPIHIRLSLRSAHSCWVSAQSKRSQQVRYRSKSLQPRDTWRRESRRRLYDDCQQRHCAGSPGIRLVARSRQSRNPRNVDARQRYENAELAGGLPIEAGKSVSLAPGGYHLMLMGLKAPLKQGDKIPVTLTFAKAGKVEVTLDVQGIAAQRPGGMSMPPNDGGHMHKM